MQLSLGFEDAPSPLADVYARLASAFGLFRDGPRLSPLDQLVKAMVGARAHDEVAWPAFRRLKTRFLSWEALAEAEPAEVEAAIVPVPHAEAKAAWIIEALSRLKSPSGAITLEALGEIDEEAAMAWLQGKLPGVGPKAAATVLNFSTLRRRALVVDAHVWRVARRIGLAPKGADPEATRRTITEAMPATWSADDVFDLHWLLKRLGQTLCMDSRTRCGACPVASLCASRGQAQAPGARTGNVLPMQRRNKP